MAAEGLTNREIAQALFVTEKTVETHLGRAFSKLGVRSRKQLAEALAEVPNDRNLRRPRRVTATSGHAHSRRSTSARG